MGAYTEDAAKVALVVGLLVLAYAGTKQLQRQPAAESRDEADEVVHAKD